MANFLMYGAGGGEEYMTTWSTPIPVGALGVDPGGLYAGYARRVGVPLRAVTTWGVISGGD